LRRAVLRGAQIRWPWRVEELPAVAVEVRRRQATRRAGDEGDEGDEGKGPVDRHDVLRGGGRIVAHVRSARCEIRAWWTGVAGPRHASMQVSALRRGRSHRVL